MAILNRPTQQPPKASRVSGPQRAEKKIASRPFLGPLSNCLILCIHASDLGLNEGKDLMIEISLAKYTGNTERCRHAFLPYVGHISLHYVYSGCVY